MRTVRHPAPARARLALALMALLALAACDGGGSGGDDDARRLQDRFGPAFAAVFDRRPDADPVEPTGNELRPADPAADPIAF